MATSRMVPATSVTGVYGDLLDHLDMGVDRRSAVAELATLLADPWDDHRADAGLRSTLTECGAPFEVSLKLGRTEPTALRYVVDTADHRRGLLANRDRYLRHARQTTGAPDATLNALLDCHLETPGADRAPDPPARVMHGVEHARRHRRASLYFPSSRWAPADLRARVTALPGVPPPECHGADLLPGVSEAIEVVGYDFVEGRVAAAKTYRWLAVTDGERFADRAAAHPDMDAPTSVYRAFADGVPAGARDRAGFLQLTGSEAVPKLFFFPGPWGWSTPEGLGTLLRFLAGDLEIDLRPLLALRAAAGAHDLPLALGLVAVGGPGSDPTATCSLWPT